MKELLRHLLSFSSVEAMLFSIFGEVSWFSEDASTGCVACMCRVLAVGVVFGSRRLDKTAGVSSDLMVP